MLEWVLSKRPIKAGVFFSKIQMEMTIKFMYPGIWIMNGDRNHIKTGEMEKQYFLREQWDKVIFELESLNCGVQVSCQQGAGVYHMERRKNKTRFQPHAFPASTHNAPYVREGLSVEINHESMLAFKCSMNPVKLYQVSLLSHPTPITPICN